MAEDVVTKASAWAVLDGILVARISRLVMLVLAGTAPLVAGSLLDKATTVSEAVTKMRLVIEPKLDEVTADVKILKTDVNLLKIDVAELKVRTRDLSQDMERIKDGKNR